MIKKTIVVTKKEYNLIKDALSTVISEFDGVPDSRKWVCSCYDLLKKLEADEEE